MIYDGSLVVYLILKSGSHKHINFLEAGYAYSRGAD